MMMMMMMMMMMSVDTLRIQAVGQSDEVNC